MPLDSGAESRPRPPSQARSVATFAKIIDTARDIIVERGIQGLNTNLVAERAGVNIGTVYHYFPDKTAIVRELFRIDQAERSEGVIEVLQALPSATDLDRFVRQLLSLVRALRHQHPSTAVLRRAFHAVPELVEVEARDAEATAATLARLVRVREPSLSAERAMVCARLLIETMGTVMDSDLAIGPDAEAYFEEVGNLLVAYLRRLSPAPS